MKKYQAEKFAIAIAREILQTNPNAIISSDSYDKKSADDVADFILELSSRLESDLGDDPLDKN
ncbi:hypothetical protein [Gilliamella sp. Pas-s25]|uniref:hypothetical protein n=1 Tax=Gilliamella sp. Pas-s25 TaxID=2687310 RepID=UPI00135D8714|nr:hypothetical protein [Gilliamella sp. Pas-s25]MWP61081.1 hypothetical protein [Gilliamella sp. Pas-s25]